MSNEVKVDIKLNENKQIQFICGNDIKLLYEDRLNQAANQLEYTNRNNSDFHLPIMDYHLLAKHPLSQCLLAYKSGFISHSRADMVILELKRLNMESIDFLSKDKIQLLQLGCLLPESDTRGESIYLSNDFNYSQTKLDDSIQFLTKSCGDNFSELINIVKVLSIVKAASQEDLPYFSGASSDTWGAIHSTEPEDDFILAEIITHESAHHWLFLQEEIMPLADNAWSGNKWASPWRSDPRPIGGVIHGVFVFSCAATVLASSIFRSQNLDNKLKERVLNRIIRLIAQVEIALEEMAKCNHLTELGRLIRDDAICRINQLEPLLDSKKLKLERSKTLHEHNTKK